MPNKESVGKKIVEALKKQAETLEPTDEALFEEDSVVSETVDTSSDIFADDNPSGDIFADDEPAKNMPANFFDEEEVEEDSDPFMSESINQAVKEDSASEFEMPSNISVLKKLISQLPSGVSRHTGAQIIKQTMEALGISMKSVLQDAQQVQENLKVSARECQSSIQDYKKQILALEKQSQGYQKQYSALNDLISLFIQTTK